MTGHLIKRSDGAFYMGEAEEVWWSKSKTHAAVYDERGMAQARTDEFNALNDGYDYEVVEA